MEANAAYKSAFPTRPLLMKPTSTPYFCTMVRYRGGLPSARKTESESESENCEDNPGEPGWVGLSVGNAIVGFRSNSSRLPW